MRVAFISDGGPEIGMGHVIRSLALANEFKEADFEVMFLSSLARGIQKIKEAGFDVKCVEDISSVDSIKDAIKANLDLIIIDSYRVNFDYFIGITKNAKRIAYIDDLNKFIHPVDILINGNITGKTMGYEKYNQDHLQLLGTEYNLIRPEFKGLPARRISKKVNEIMVTTGESDPYGLTLLFIKWITEAEKLVNVKLHVVIGSSFQNKEAIRFLESKHSNVIIHENVNKMSEVMLISDLAVSASGSTLYELCACGTPTVGFVMADNQNGIGEKFAKEGYIKQLGWYENLSKEMFLDKLESLIDDYELRVAMSGKMQKLVDGNGCKRIVEEILLLLQGG